jgi:imidazole glycerol-phosphate synthase subunit HisH
MITIIDYGLGNLGSIANMLKKLGFDSAIISNPRDLENASQIILPGVGAFDTGMKYLKDNHWLEELNKKVLIEKIPTLGICLGMQLMTESSEEGVLPGLGWVKGTTKKFTFSNNDLRIPHMGWNTVTVKKASRILPQDGSERRFYFVHSYFVNLEDQNNLLVEATYGNSFAAGFEVENIVGVQFHPEKSHRFGMELLRNFAANLPILDSNVKNKSNTMPVA